MVGGRAVAAGEIQPFVVGLHLRAGQHLRLRMAQDLGRGEQAAHQPQPAEQHLPVAGGGEVVGLDHRILPHIGAARAHMAVAFRPVLPGARGHAGVVVQLVVAAFLVAAGGEHALQVWRVQPLEALPEHEDLAGHDGEDGGPAGRPARHLAHQARALGHFVQRDRALLRPAHQPHRVVVAEILAHAGQLVPHLHAQLAQQPCRADAGDLQQPRRVHRAAGENHLPPRPNLLRRAAAGGLVADAHGALALQHHLAGAGIGTHLQVRAGHGGLQQAARRTYPLAVLDGALEIAHAALVAAVVVWVARDAGVDRAFDERL